MMKNLFLLMVFLVLATPVMANIGCQTPSGHIYVYHQNWMNGRLIYRYQQESDRINHPENNYNIRALYVSASCIVNIETGPVYQLSGRFVEYNLLDYHISKHIWFLVIIVGCIILYSLKKLRDEMQAGIGKGNP